MPLMEPWMSGSFTDVHPALRTLLHSLEHVRLEMREWTAGLTTDQLWARPHGITAAGFHIRHIAGSTERLFTYAEGRRLDEAQLAALKAEAEPGASCEELLQQVDSMFETVAAKTRLIDPATLTEPRAIGRKQLPTTVIGLLVHIGEHNLRHLGQLVVSVKVLRAIG